MDQLKSIFWFRQDLRLSDNLGLIESCKIGGVLPIYILDDLAPKPFKMGSVSKIYLHYSLQSLNKSLEEKLNLYIGNSKQIITQLVQKYNIKNVFWNRCYEPWRIIEDKIIEEKLRDLKINCITFNGSYLWEPKEIKKEDGSYYKVFGAYKRKVYSCLPRRPLTFLTSNLLIKDYSNFTELKDFKLISSQSWEKKITAHWEFGEKAAQKKMNTFLQHHLFGYKVGRDYPGKNQTSRLSVNLHFGEISPHQVWESVSSAYRLDSFKNLGAYQEDVEHFLSELIWREFSCYLMTHFRELPWKNFQEKFDRFPWRSADDELFHAWKSGNTGYPIIDAGMRELLQTGYMHNRVRMIVASFLVKNLMIHWNHGRDWFWECLVDADLANNSASWQWVAGSGADAAPYFRIFNPTTQGQKFDSQGEYTKKFVPELEKLPSKYLFEPWKAFGSALQKSEINCSSYSSFIVDLKFSRERALSAYKML